MKYGTLLRIIDINEAGAQFEKLRDYGFTSCQLVYKPEIYDVKDAKIIKKAAADSGIEISAQFCGYKDMNMVWDIYYGYMTAGVGIEAYRKERVEYIKAAAEFAKEAGTDDIVIHAGFVPNNPFAPEYAALQTSVELIASHCEKQDTNLLFETGGESPIVLLRLIEDVGRKNLYINLDPANIIMYGYGNPVDALYTFGKYVRNVHGKDGMPPTNPRQLGLETPVGKGFVDFYELFKKLHELNYDRFITIEREIEGDKQIKDILAAKRFFEEILDRVNK